jgi:hypothetical protein
MKKIFIGIKVEPDQAKWLKAQTNYNQLIRRLIDRAMRQDVLSEQWRKTCEEPEVTK